MTRHSDMRTIPETIIIPEIPAPHMFEHGWTDRDILHEHARRVGIETVRVGRPHTHEHAGPQGALLTVDYMDSGALCNQEDLRKIMPVKRERPRPAEKSAGGPALAVPTDVTPAQGFHYINKTEYFVIGQVESKRRNGQDGSPL